VRQDAEHVADLALVRAVAAGDELALAELYDRHAGWLLVRLRRRCASADTWSNQLDRLSSLSRIPLTNLLVILVGIPLAAAVIGWLAVGRDPADISRQPLE
jgi:hypothetical protein